MATKNFPAPEHVLSGQPNLIEQFDADRNTVQQTVKEALTGCEDGELSFHQNYEERPIRAEIFRGTVESNRGSGQFGSDLDVS